MSTKRMHPPNEIRRPDKVLITDYLTQDEINKKQTKRLKKIKKYNVDWCEICDTKFSSEKDLTRHLKIKRDCMGTMSILAKEFLPSNMILVCPNANCCYSTKDLKSYKTHLVELHNLSVVKAKSKRNDNTPVRVLTLISKNESSDVVMCGKCLGRYVNKDAYTNHRKNCSGKQNRIKYK